MSYILMDIGNTSIKAKIFDVKNKEASTIIANNEKAIRLFFNKMSSSKIMISSVVPSINDFIMTLNHPSIHFLKHDDFKDIKINVKPIESVGIDRLVDAMAAYKLWECNSLIIDIGTAITCCNITKSGEFKGGIIMPGFHMFRNALHDHTAQLPLINFPDNEPPLIGNSTKSAIQSGLFHGSINMINGIQHQIKGHQSDMKVILTGNIPSHLISHINHDIYDRDLAFKGMQILFQKLI